VRISPLGFDTRNEKFSLRRITKLIASRLINRLINVRYE
jgi:hypothetical protein